MCSSDLSGNIEDKNRRSETHRIFETNVLNRIGGYGRDLLVAGLINFGNQVLNRTFFEGLVLESDLFRENFVEEDASDRRFNDPCDRAVEADDERFLFFDEFGLIVGGFDRFGNDPLFLVPDRLRPEFDFGQDFHM